MTTTKSVQDSFKNYFGDGSDLEFIYEDEQCAAFDAKKNLQAPIHFVVVPKKVIPRLSQASLDDEKLLGHLLMIAKKIAIRRGLHMAGYHVVVDEDYRTMKFKGIHVFGRALMHMLWPIGPGCRL